MEDRTGRPKRIDQASIDQIEKETLELVISSLPEIEKNLASWDNIKDKPEILRNKFEKYRLIHQSLSSWARSVLTSSEGDYEARLDRMWEFVSICRVLKGLD